MNQRKRYLSMIICLLILAVGPDAEQPETRLETGLHGPVKEIVTTRINFNTNGQNRTSVIDRISFNEAGYRTVYQQGSRRIEYFYNNENKLIEEKVYNSNRLESHLEITYNPDGTRQEQRRQYSRDYRRMYLAWSILYSGTDEIIERKQFHSNGKLIRHLFTEKKAGGKQRISLGYNDRGTETSREILTYNQLDQLIEKYTKTAYYNREAKFSYTYNSHGDMSQAVLALNFSKETPLTWQYVYDGSHRLQTVTRQSPDGKTLSRRKYVYRDGSLVEEDLVCYDTGQTPLYSYHYSYDRYGNVYEEKYTNLGKNTNFIKQWEFDTLRNATREGLYNNEGFFLSGFLKEYDGQGRNTASRTYKEAQKTDFWFTEAYRGDLLLERSDWRSGKITITRNVYDSRGLLTETSTNRDGKITITRNAYDSRGLLTETSTNRDGKIAITRNAYDSRGGLIMTSTYRDDDILVKRSDFEIEYDKHGNWIRNNVYNTYNEAEIYSRRETEDIREITYH